MTKLRVVEQTQPSSDEVSKEESLLSGRAKELGIVKGETKGLLVYPPGFYAKFLNAPVIKPNHKLSEVLYPKK